MARVCDSTVDRWVSHSDPWFEVELIGGVSDVSGGSVFVDSQGGGSGCLENNGSLLGVRLTLNQSQGGMCISGVLGVGVAVGHKGVGS